MKTIKSNDAARLVRRRVARGVTAAAVGVVVAFGTGPMSAAFADEPATLTGIILGVGAKESQRVVSWYSSTDTAQVVQVSPTDKLIDGQFPKNAVTFPATVAANSVNGGFNGHATIDGLKKDTAYSYRVGAGDSWSPTYSFKTQDFKGDFDFLFFGDPQIGSSGNVAKDGEGWKDTLDVALTATPNAELLVSGGDQVETANTEPQWDAFLAPDKLRQYPWAATIGNHDVGGKAYEQHFWTPNTDRSASYYKGSPDTQSGGDYWYIYKDVLFIDINSNAYANGADEAHLGYITDVINQQGGKAKYTVLVYHHSIYSPASHANDTDNKQRRQDFPTAFSNLGVDLVLQGHDHSYSRSYMIKNGEKANPDEQPGATQVAQGPGGVIYVTANSASGSKYYDLTAPIPGSDFGPDPLNPNSHWANSVENQEHVRTYVKVEVRDDKLVVENIRSSTCAAPNAAVELGKVKWCGPNNGADAAPPVGSVVDKVAILPYTAKDNGKHNGAGNGNGDHPAQDGPDWVRQQDVAGSETLTALN
ncbi:metallophosphoesterase family protein [Saccharopolyspora sp. ASAGF58]|uniref:purple acid phosphatase family protein n=1 Tax=Saccharopolyspora sp. ASAGF58 TaxID=2719023 RepID=UPI00143FCDA3|nr:metallophosphoesterase family protein [Saccharopolyspora sp. ASAGF58]QIZ37414.1 metallophosphoesterase family protein [Saccharopolyspora sp. ASAGF58]